MHKSQISSYTNERPVKALKVLLKYLKPYRRESILAPLFKLLEAVFDLLVPLVVAKIIDIGVTGGDSGYVVKGFLILILMAAIGFGCSVTAQFFAAKASTGFSADLRQSMFDHIQTLSFSELDRIGTDTLVTRLSDDVNQVQNGLNLGLRLLLRSPFIVFGAVIMAFTVNTRCALIFAGTVPVLFGVVFLIMLISIPLFGKVQAGLDRVTGLTRENLTGVRVIRAFRCEDRSVSEFEHESLALTRLCEFVGKLSALLNPLTYVLINIAAVLLIKSAGVQINLGHMQQGEAVALYNYMLQIITELIKLASLIITLNRSVACAKRAADILNTKSSMSYPVSSPKAENVENVVEFRGVSFSYYGAARPVLSDISFKVRRGETIGVIGGTGSGKSALVGLIPRFYDVSSGEVRVNGVNVREYPAGALSEKIGIVQQKASLFRGTVRDNLKLGNENAGDDDLWQALKTAQAEEVIRSKPGELDFELEQDGRNLSGGQRQRLTIARALVKKPEILILDDSLSALDYATDAALRRELHKLTAAGGSTLFLVSQRISAIRDADKILVMDNGRLAALGTHRELMETSSVYREIYRSQFPEEKEAAK